MCTYASEMQRSASPRPYAGKNRSVTDLSMRVACILTCLECIFKRQHNFCLAF
jgi:hypothetical protein